MKSISAMHSCKKKYRNNHLEKKLIHNDGQLLNTMPKERTMPLLMKNCLPKPKRYFKIWQSEEKL